MSESNFIENINLAETRFNNDLKPIVEVSPDHNNFSNLSNIEKENLRLKIEKINTSVNIKLELLFQIGLSHIQVKEVTFKEVFYSIFNRVDKDFQSNEDIKVDFWLDSTKVYFSIILDKVEINKILENTSLSCGEELINGLYIRKFLLSIFPEEIIASRIIPKMIHSLYYCKKSGNFDFNTYHWKDPYHYSIGLS